MPRIPNTAPTRLPIFRIVLETPSSADATSPKPTIKRPDKSAMPTAFRKILSTCRLLCNSALDENQTGPGYIVSIEIHSSSPFPGGFVLSGNDAIRSRLSSFETDRRN